MTVNMLQLADPALGKGPGYGLHPDPGPALVVYRDLRILLLRFGQHLVGLCAIDTERLFDIDVNPVFEHPQRQRVVEFGAGGDRDDIGLMTGDHGVQIGVASLDA